QCMILLSMAVIVYRNFNEWQFLSHAFSRMNKVINQKHVGASFSKAGLFFVSTAYGLMVNDGC
ncbi:MAG: hypothetical protein ACI88A_005108, partial [Paraglaciecola sp.]